MVWDRISGCLRLHCQASLSFNEIADDYHTLLYMDYGGPKPRSSHVKAKHYLPSHLPITLHTQIKILLHILFIYWDRVSCIPGWPQIKSNHANLILQPHLPRCWDYKHKALYLLHKVLRFWGWHFMHARSSLRTWATVLDLHIKTFATWFSAFVRSLYRSV